MTKEEFKQKIKDLKNEFVNNENKLIKEYVIYNSPYKVGDIIEDNIGILKIKDIKIQLSIGDDIGVPIYQGIELKKDLTPKKNLIIREVYVINIIKKVNYP